MLFLRSLLFAVFLTVLTPPYACMCIVAFPFMSAEKRYRLVSGWNWLTIRAARLLCGIAYRVIGREHLDAACGKPVVLLSKHQSAWETIAFIALMPRPLCYVFKRELLYVPFFGWALGMLKMVHINRKDGKRAFASVVRQGKQRLSEGAWVIMFPEGTRTHSGTQGQYKSGGARFATATGALVLPIAHNAGRCWPRNRFIKYPGLITVSVGPAIESAGKTPEQLIGEVEHWIETEMRTIDAESYRQATDPA